MHVFTTLLVIAATFVTQGGAVQEGGKDLLVIQGAKDPAQIPEWLAWEFSFTLVQQWQGKDSGFTHDLREVLAANEFAMLEREAVAQRTRQANRDSQTDREHSHDDVIVGSEEGGWAFGEKMYRTRPASSV